MSKSLREPFIRAILDEPDDDLPRLVYADWLDEHDDPERADFIRVQCELAKRGPGAAHVAALDSCECADCSLRRRARTLLSARALKWLPRHVRPPSPAHWRTSEPGLVVIDTPVAALDADYPYLSYIRFARGFPEVVGIELPDPTFQAVAIRAADTVGKLLAACPIREVLLSWAGLAVTVCCTIRADCDQFELVADVLPDHLTIRQAGSNLARAVSTLGRPFCCTGKRSAFGAAFTRLVIDLAPFAQRDAAAAADAENTRRIMEETPVPDERDSPWWS